MRGNGETYTVDGTDARILHALTENPRATVVAIAQRLGLSRNTVQARLERFDERNALLSFEHRVDPAILGYRLSAFINIQVTQRELAKVGDALAAIPEVVEVSGLSGSWDLLARVVARDADDLYRIAGHILATPGVERTESSLVMRKLVDHRLLPLIEAAF